MEDYGDSEQNADEAKRIDLDEMRQNDRRKRVFIIAITIAVLSLIYIFLNV